MGGGSARARGAHGLTACEHAAAVGARLCQSTRGCPSAHCRARGESGRDEAGKDRFGGGAQAGAEQRGRVDTVSGLHTQRRTRLVACCTLSLLSLLSLYPPRFPPSTGWLALAPPHLLCSAPFGSRPPRVSGRRPRPSLTLPSRTSTARPSYGHSGSSWRTCAAMSRPSCACVPSRRPQACAGDRYTLLALTSPFPF